MYFSYRMTLILISKPLGALQARQYELAFTPASRPAGRLAQVFPYF
jgi:hypothetical protein